MSDSEKTAAPDWIWALLRGDRVAMARAITAVENETDDAPAVLAAIHPRLGHALVVGVTGAPGAGKSTLVGALVDALRRHGKTVGVIAVDPSSPLTGGAILGDRIRMTRHSTDDGVFVRSLASRGHLGGLSRTASRVIDVMDAAGKDVVIVETVGTGQSEVEVAEIADCRVVVCAPGLGDDIQAIKAGILEIADILVVNKGDSPLAERSLRQMKAMAGSARPVLRTTATTGEGVGDLMEDILRRGKGVNRPDPARRTSRLLTALAADRLRQKLERAGDPAREAALTALVEALLDGEIGFEAAADEAIGLAAGSKMPDRK